MNIEKYLSSYYKGSKKPSLNAMKYLTEELNHPEKKLKVIHIAGTNGKGSCAEIITRILINAGYRVGKYIGPHLIKYNERISIQNKNISCNEMETLIKRLQPLVEKYNSTHNLPVSVFELLTTIAFLYFSENNCDFVVLETGLGGLHDSTNVVNSMISIITSIDYDHMHILGRTLKQIAKQKAGIIKENSETIFALSDNRDVNEEVEQTCKMKKTNLNIVKLSDVKNYSYNNYRQKFDYKEYKNININLKGEKQVLNSIIAIECINILKRKLYKISDYALYTGLKTVVHKGRFERINSKPLMIYDGAHNLPAIENFIRSCDMYYRNRKKVYIVSILNTKDYKSIIKKLLKDVDAVFIFTDGHEGKSYVPKEELLELAKTYSNSTKLYAKTINEATKDAYIKYKDEVIFFVGSLYVYGTVVQQIKELKKVEKQI